VRRLTAIAAALTALAVTVSLVARHKFAPHASRAGARHAPARDRLQFSAKYKEGLVPPAEVNLPRGLDIARRKFNFWPASLRFQCRYWAQICPEPDSRVARYLKPRENEEYSMANQGGQQGQNPQQKPGQQQQQPGQGGGQQGGQNPQQKPGQQQQQPGQGGQHDQKPGQSDQR
jgi:hypothetical protein